MISSRLLILSKPLLYYVNMGILLCKIIIFYYITAVPPV
jgi:hypothetical protein